MSKSTLQHSFFEQMADPQGFRAMFEHLPDVFFFVKDRGSRMIAGSRNLVERLGLKRESEMIGRPDEAFFQPHIARAFRDDDEQVFRTGKPLTNRLEVWYDEQRNLDWFLTTKVPVRGRNGTVIGLMGITRRDEGLARHQPARDVAKVLGFIQSHSDRILTTAALARASGLSERTLYRKVNQALGVTPYELMLRIRIQKAAEALIKTNAKVMEIAAAHGFCDQSTFTQHFRKRTGMTPKQFRLRHQI
jgi:AraC-like DNA-binding protein